MFEAARTQIKRLQTKLAEPLPPKDKYERRLDTRSKVKLLGVAMVLIAGATFAAQHYDGIVARNVAFRSSKFLDLVFPPASRDVANAKLIDTYMDSRWNVMRQNRARFALWDYCDLREALKKAATRPRSWSQLVQLRMRLWGDLLDAKDDRRFTIEKDKCVMLEMLQTLQLPHPKVRRTWRSVDAKALKRYPPLLKWATSTSRRARSS